MLGVLTLGLTGCYTQLQTTDEDPAAEASAEQTARTQGAPFDPAAPVASLRRANPDSREELVSLGRALQAARADTEISFDEYRDGVRFFRTNYPGFYGNFFGDPFYATYDAQYQRTARAAWLVGLDINPHQGFRNMTGGLCAPHGYDPAFGCRSWAYRPSDFFSLPGVFALPGLESARYANRFLWSPFHRSPYYGFRDGWGRGSRSLYGFRAPYGYGSLYGHRGSYGYGSGLSATVPADGSDGSVGDRRENRPRRGTVGRGGTSAGAGGDADRSRRSGVRADRGRFAEGRSGQSTDERERPSRSDRTESDDRDRSGASERRGDAVRHPQMLTGPVFSGDDETSALASVGDVGLERIRVPMPDIEDASREQKLRTFRALQRIAEETDGGTLSIEERDEISERIQRLVRAQREARNGRSRPRTSNAPDMGRGDQRASGGRGDRAGRDSSGSDRGASRSGGRDRSGSGDSGRDRSRSGSGDSGGRQ